jgi:hypothetical protein
MTDHLGYEPTPLRAAGPVTAASATIPRPWRPRLARWSCGSRGTAPAASTPAPSARAQRRLDGLTGTVVSLYAKGLTTGHIQAHVAEIYGTEVSRDTISRITDTTVEDLVSRQNRPPRPCVPGDSAGFPWIRTHVTHRTTTGPRRGCHEQGVVARSAKGARARIVQPPIREVLSARVGPADGARRGSPVFRAGVPRSSGRPVGAGQPGPLEGGQ